MRVSRWCVCVWTRYSRCSVVLYVGVCKAWGVKGSLCECKYVWEDFSSCVLDLLDADDRRGFPLRMKDTEEESSGMDKVKKVLIAQESFVFALFCRGSSLSLTGWEGCDPGPRLSFICREGWALLCTRAAPWSLWSDYTGKRKTLWFSWHIFVWSLQTHTCTSTPRHLTRQLHGSKTKRRDSSATSVSLKWGEGLLSRFGSQRL